MIKMFDFLRKVWNRIGFNLKLQSKYAYVSEDDGVTVYNIEDPTKPFVVGRTRRQWGRHY